MMSRSNHRSMLRHRRWPPPRDRRSSLQLWRVRWTRGTCCHLGPRRSPAGAQRATQHRGRVMPASLLRKVWLGPGMRSRMAFDKWHAASLAVSIPSRRAQKPLCLFAYQLQVDPPQIDGIMDISRLRQDSHLGQHGKPPILPLTSNDLHRFPFKHAVSNSRHPSRIPGSALADSSRWSAPGGAAKLPLRWLLHGPTHRNCDDSPPGCGVPHLARVRPDGKY